jgi:hypothetical protein
VPETRHEQDGWATRDLSSELHNAETFGVALELNITNEDVHEGKELDCLAERTTGPRENQVIRAFDRTRNGIDDRGMVVGDANPNGVGACLRVRIHRIGSVALQRGAPTARWYSPPAPPPGLR